MIHADIFVTSTDLLMFQEILEFHILMFILIFISV